MTNIKSSLFSGNQPSVTSHKLIIYTDGGSRGNPGPSAIGYVVGDKEYGECIGNTTNNVAEYKAISASLRKAKVLLGKTKAKQTDVEVRMDSELACRQLSGIYRIENLVLQPLFFEVWNLKFDFKSVKFVHVPREENKKADAMVNYALDNN
jgi:ribonuclease HI